MQEQIVETKQCKSCWITFHITDKDMDFYDKISPILEWKKHLIPSPKLCPDCRQQRRMAFKNIYHIYKDEKKSLISPFSPDKELNVVLQKNRRENQDLWLSFWTIFDNHQSFSQQFKKLQKIAPRRNLIQVNSENCEWSMNMSWSKKCYLIRSGVNAENCYYGERIIDSTYILDGYRIHESENCYDSSYLKNCYQVFFGNKSKWSKNSLYISNCDNVSNCIGCVWLRNKNYHILNKSVSQEYFENYKKELLFSKDFRGKFKKEFNNLYYLIPKKYAEIDMSENVTGNEISNSKNGTNCFAVSNVYDVSNVFDWANAKTSMDLHAPDEQELSYECSSNFKLYNCGFCFNSVFLNNCFYCETCANLDNCFWCVWLNQKQYCIFNKQYTKEEYERIVPQIIEKMQIEWERGEFFPASLSPFGYNESSAMEDFPLTKQEAIEKWFNRSDYEAPFPQVDKILKSSELPNIQEVTEEILQQAIECEVTKKPFRIIKQELEFYKKHNLPLPTKHPDQRHKERMALRNPRKLRDRNCMKCWIDIKTSYSPEREEIVYCEACYNKEIYW